MPHSSIILTVSNTMGSVSTVTIAALIIVSGHAGHVATFSSGCSYDIPGSMLSVSVLGLIWGVPIPLAGITPPGLPQSTFTIQVLLKQGAVTYSTKPLEISTPWFQSVAGWIARSGP